QRRVLVPFGRNGDGPRVADRRVERLAAQEPEKARVRAERRGEPPQPIEVGSRADQVDPDVGPRRGRDQRLDALLDREPAEIHEAPPGIGSRADAARIDEVRNVDELLALEAPFGELAQIEPARHDEAIDVADVTLEETMQIAL